MARSQISICNGALDECPAASINSIDEDSLEANACKRRYEPVLEDLLGEHDYDGAVRRTTLAQTTNDRMGEWLFCYSQPENIAKPLRVLPTFTAAFVSSAYVLQPGQQVWNGVGFYPDNVGARYIIADGKIYTNMPTAVFEYISYDVALGTFRPLFFRAFELSLAARIVMPILKDSKRQATLITMAELARQRAIADDLNAGPERTFDFMSEDAQVRLGMVDPRLAGNIAGPGGIY